MCVCVVCWGGGGAVGGGNVQQVSCQLRRVHCHVVDVLRLQIIFY